MSLNLKPPNIRRASGAKSAGGFTLFELLIQIAIFAVIAALLFGITMIAFRVKNKGLADAEVLGQLNFVMQTIQRMTRESTIVYVPASSTLDLWRNSATTTFSLSSGVIKLKEGAAAQTDLTTDEVVVDDLSFTQVTNSGAPDSVQISITFHFNTNNPFASSTRTIRSSASPLY
jgi:type II secretory pathway pseudopilin PulG